MGEKTKKNGHNKRSEKIVPLPLKFDSHWGEPSRTCSLHEARKTALHQQKTAGKPGGESQHRGKTIFQERWEKNPEDEGETLSRVSLRKAMMEVSPEAAA